MGLGFTCDEWAYDFALFNNFINKKITLRMKLRLKSRLKTIKAHQLVEDFTEEAPDATLASVMTTVVMFISFLFREEAILKFKKNQGCI